jgi:putative salt-induced outer membrane protein YdiY
MPPHALRPCALLALLAVPRVAAGQDSTRVRPDSARERADSTRRSATAQRPDTPQVQVPRVRVPPPVQPPWRFQVDLGFQDVAGNRDLTVFNSAFTVERLRQDRLLLVTHLEARYGRSQGQTSVNTQLARVRLDWTPRARISPFLGLDLNRDPIRKLKLRTQLGTGLNLNISVRDESRTQLSVGFVGDFQRFTAGVAPGHAEDTRLYTRFHATRLFAQSTRFEASVRVQPALQTFADYLLSADASLRFAVTRQIGFLTRYEYLRDSRPPAGVQPADRSFNLSLSIAW